MNKDISDKDKKDWEDFIKSKDKLEIKDKEHYTDNKNLEKSIDLHGYTLSDANLAVKNLIVSSYNNGLSKLNIITGKGTRSKNMEDPYKSNKFSILKYSVPEFIQGDKELFKMVKKIDLKSIDNQNSGQFSIYLKKK